MRTALKRGQRVATTMSRKPDVFERMVRESARDAFGHSEDVDLLTCWASNLLRRYHARVRRMVKKELAYLNPSAYDYAVKHIIYKLDRLKTGRRAVENRARAHKGG